MKYEGMGTSRTLKEKIDSLMELSSNRYKNDTTTYKQLKADCEEYSYFKRKYDDILSWLSAIFGRFEECKISKEIICPRLNEYSDEEQRKMKLVAIDDINKIVRLHMYIADCFFRYENRSYLQDYQSILQLFEKICTDFDWNYYSRHDYIDEVYSRIWDKESESRAKKEIDDGKLDKGLSKDEIDNLKKEIKLKKLDELDNYFLYHETFDVLSEDLPDFDIKGGNFRFIELNTKYKNLKSYFLKIVTSYITAFNGNTNYDVPLTDVENGFIELVYDLSEEYKGKRKDIEQDRWEVISVERRTEIISYIDELYQYGEDVINKYMGVQTSQELRLRVEAIKYKLEHPVSYRILTKLEDINAELPLSRRLEEMISNNITCEERENLKQVERKLKDILKLMCKMNKEMDICFEQIDENFREKR